MKTRTLFLLFLLTLSCHPTTRAGVLPPDSVVGDKTISEWTAEWWMWTLGISTNQHPFFDTTGAYATINQPDGPVFFLAGVITISGVQQRSFSVPEGKYLFLPLQNAQGDNVNVDPPLTVEKLREAIAANIDMTTELHASIDGVQIPTLFDYRVSSPVYSYDYATPDNWLSWVIGAPFVGFVDPIVSDGYWLMIEPLPPGEHVINFGSTVGPPINFTLDITDTITVVAVPLSQRVGELLSVVAAAHLTRHRAQPLRASLEVAQASFAKHNLHAGMNQLRAFQHKVSAQLAPHHQATAAELIQAAQTIIDRAARPQTDLP